MAERESGPTQVPGHYGGRSLPCGKWTGSRCGRPRAGDHATQALPEPFGSRRYVERVLTSRLTDLGKVTREYSGATGPRFQDRKTEPFIA
jgi:hypothetical protein